MRNGSSPKDTSAGAGVRSTPSANEVLFDPLPESDHRFAGAGFVGVGAEGGDLDLPLLVALLLHGANGPEIPTDVPGGGSEITENGVGLVGTRRGGEVQVVAEPSQHRIAHRTTDKVQSVPRRVETGTEVAYHLRDAEQFGDGVALGLGEVWHGRRVYAGAGVGRQQTRERCSAADGMRGLRRLGAR